MSLVQGLHDDWYTVDAPEDVEVLAVLIEDTQGSPADVEDGADFVQFTGVTFPVLCDTDQAWIADWGAGGSGSSRHSYTIIASDGTVGWRIDDGGSVTVEQITDGLEGVQ